MTSVLPNSDAKPVAVVTRRQLRDERRDVGALGGDDGDTTFRRTAFRRAAFRQRQPGFGHRVADPPVGLHARLQGRSPEDEVGLEVKVRTSLNLGPF